MARNGLLCADVPLRNYSINCQCSSSTDFAPSTHWRLCTAQTLNRVWYVSSWHGDVNLRVIIITVGSETMTGDDIEQFCGVPNKEQGSADW